MDRTLSHASPANPQYAFAKPEDFTSPSLDLGLYLLACSDVRMARRADGKIVALAMSGGTATRIERLMPSIETAVEFHCENVSITDNSVRIIVDKLPNLELLDFRGCNGISEESATALLRLKSLKMLCIDTKGRHPIFLSKLKIALGSKLYLDDSESRIGLWSSRLVKDTELHNVRPPALHGPEGAEAYRWRLYLLKTQGVAFAHRPDGTVRAIWFYPERMMNSTPQIISMMPIMESVDEVCCQFSDVTDSSICELTLKVPNLRLLNLYRCDRLTQGSFAEALSRLTDLQKVFVDEPPPEARDDKQHKIIKTLRSVIGDRLVIGNSGDELLTPLSEFYYGTEAGVDDPWLKSRTKP